MQSLAAPKLYVSTDIPRITTTRADDIQRPSAPRTDGTCFKHTADERQNQYVRMASEISGNDKTFLALLDAENGLWTPTRKSTAVGSNGYRDVGFCQINPGFHPKIFYDKRFLTDPKWQLEQCYKLYLGGTTFYGRRHISKTIKYFTCS